VNFLARPNIPGAVRNNLAGVVAAFEVAAAAAVAVAVVQRPGPTRSSGSSLPIWRRGWASPVDEDHREREQRLGEAAVHKRHRTEAAAFVAVGVAAVAARTRVVGIGSAGKLAIQKSSCPSCRRAAGTADIAVAEVPAAHMRGFWVAAEEALPRSNSSIAPAAAGVAAAARKGWEQVQGRRS